MSYLIFDSQEIYTNWSSIVDDQRGLPDEYAKRYTKKIVHPTTLQWACVFNTVDYVQPPEGSQLVEEEYMFEHGWFQRNGEQ